MKYCILGGILAAGLVVTGCDTPADPAKAQRQIAVEQAEGGGLQALLEHELSDFLGINDAAFELYQDMQYHTDTFPFRGFRPGLYHALRDIHSDDRYFFSRRGDFIGMVYPAPEHNIWFSVLFEDGYPAVVEEYARNKGAHFTIKTSLPYTETPIGEDLVRRTHCAVKPGLGVFPLYFISLGGLGDARPFLASYQDHVESIGHKDGMFFLVESTIREGDNVMEEHGRFYHQGSGLVESVPVFRITGTKKLLLDDPHSAGEAQLFQTIVPSAIQD